MQFSVKLKRAFIGKNQVRIHKVVSATAINLNLTFVVDATFAFLRSVGKAEKVVTEVHTVDVQCAQFNLNFHIVVVDHTSIST